MRTSLNQCMTLILSQFIAGETRHYAPKPTSTPLSLKNHPGRVMVGTRKTSTFGIS